MRIPSRPPGIGPLAVLLLIAAASPALTGCAGVAAAAFGAGATAGVQHTLNGINYRTFSAPEDRVKAAALRALEHMGIKPLRPAAGDPPGVIRAAARDRSIELDFEDVASNTTRMRAVARQGFFYDSATAYEIMMQTEHALAAAQVRPAAGHTSASRAAAGRSQVASPKVNASTVDRLAGNIE